MAFKMKGSAFYGRGNQSPLPQKKATLSSVSDSLVNLPNPAHDKNYANYLKRNKAISDSTSASNQKVFEKRANQIQQNVSPKEYKKQIKDFEKKNPAPTKQKSSQASKAKKVVARNTSGKDMLKYNDPQDISAVQTDKKGNKFVTSLTDDESYSGFDDNPVTTSRKGFKDFDFDVDRTAPRDTFMVSKNYPHGSLIDETEMQTGKAQKKGSQPRKKNY